jgi:hypothetical protein
MEIVECPFCAARVTNDGSLSLQVVTCPVCRQQFQMPAAPAPAPAPAPPAAGPPEEPPHHLADEPTEDPEGDAGGSALRRRRAARRGPRLWVVAVWATVVFWVGVFFVLWASGFLSGGAGRSRKPARPRPTEKKSHAPRPAASGAGPDRLGAAAGSGRM